MSTILRHLDEQGHTGVGTEVLGVKGLLTEKQHGPALNMDTCTKAKYRW